MAPARGCTRRPRPFLVSAATARRQLPAPSRALEVKWLIALPRAASFAPARSATCAPPPALPYCTHIPRTCHLRGHPSLKNARAAAPVPASQLARELHARRKRTRQPWRPGAGTPEGPPAPLRSRWPPCCCLHWLRRQARTQVRGRGGGPRPGGRREYGWSALRRGRRRSRRHSHPALPPAATAVCPSPAARILKMHNTYRSNHRCVSVSPSSSCRRRRPCSCPCRLPLSPLATAGGVSAGGAWPICSVSSQLPPLDLAQRRAPDLVRRLECTGAGARRRVHIRAFG